MTNESSFSGAFEVNNRVREDAHTLNHSIHFR